MNQLMCRPDESGGYDFVIDGVFLRERVYGPAPRNRFGRAQSDGRNITLLRRSLFTDTVLGQLRRLRGEEPGDFIADRVWLYFCPMCFDEVCGGVSVRIGHGADTVTWSDFLHDSSYEPDDTAPVEPALEFSFAREPYLAELKRVERALFSNPLLKGLPGGMEFPRLGLERFTHRAWLRKKAADRGPQFTIDGEPLGKVLAAADTESLLGNVEYSILISADARADPARLRAVLLGEVAGRYFPGRVVLLTGPAKGKDDALVTARLTRIEGTVQWDDFRVHGPGAGWGNTSMPLGRPVRLRFDAGQYDALIAAWPDAEADLP